MCQFLDPDRIQLPANLKVVWRSGLCMAGFQPGQFWGSIFRSGEHNWSNQHQFFVKLAETNSYDVIYIILQDNPIAIIVELKRSEEFIKN